MEYLPYYQGVLVGIIGVLLFRYKNPNKSQINIISISMLLIFVSEIFSLNSFDSIGLLVWITSGLSFAISYFIRFRDRQPKKVIDYIKLLCVFLIIAQPISFHLHHLEPADDIFIALILADFLLFSLLIFILDRWVLNFIKMNKKFVMILIGQTVLFLIILTYAYVQQGIAKEQEQMALEQAILATKNAELARKEAEQYFQASKRVAELESELEKCRKK